MADPNTAKKPASPDPAMQLAPPHPVSGPWTTPGSDIPDFGVDPGQGVPVPIFSAAAQSANSAAPQSPVPGVIGAVSKPQPTQSIQDIANGKEPAPQPISPLPTPASQMPTYAPSMLSKIAGFARTAAPIAGAVGNALGAAMGTPEQKQISEENVQMGLQRPKIQAETEATEAETALRRKQAELMGQMAQIVLPGGQIMQVPMSQMGNYLKGGFAAQVGAQGKIDVAKLQIELAKAQVSRVAPVRDDKGNMVMRAYNKFGMPIVDIPGELPPASYLPTTTQGGEWKLDKDNNYVWMPTTSVKLPNTKGGPPDMTAQGPVKSNVQGKTPGMQTEFEHDYEKPAEEAEQSFQMANAAYNDFKTAQAQGRPLPTGAQSMLMLSQHLQTTFGGVKGARVTKDMIAEHLGARSISDSALVAVQKLTNGDVLSPDQWEAFYQLISQSRSQHWQTALREAPRHGVDVTGLPIPKELQQANGGPVPGPINNAVRSQSVLSPADQKTAAKVLYHGQRAYQKGTSIYGAQDGKYLGETGR